MNINWLRVQATSARLAVFRERAATVANNEPDTYMPMANATQVATLLGADPLQEYHYE